MSEIDEAISKLPPVLCEFPDDREYCANMAGQVRSFPITQDTRKAIQALIDQEVKKAVEFTLKNVSSIDYPPSGKTYNFEGGEWRNLLSMATEYVLAELEGEK